MRKNNRIFLQHGITINKGEWLFYKNTNFRLFITAALQEYEYISKNFGYPYQNLKLCGFTRFDTLHDVEEDKNLILVMPTWRGWIRREGYDNKHNDFCETQYFKSWNEFINSVRLNQLLIKYNKRLLFFPHRNMQKYLNKFNTMSDRIDIANIQVYDVQMALKKSTLLITDYSSVFFDFSYMRKPVIFYQFDEEEFREKQYAEGYFNYHSTVLGQWADNIDDVLNILEVQLENGIKHIDKETIRQFFPLWDTNNCRRNYEAIKNI